MERKRSDESTSSSETQNRVGEAPKLSVTIPQTPLLGSLQQGSVNTATSPSVTASSTRRRYSWNLHDDGTTTKAHAHRVSVSRLPDRRLFPLTDESGTLQHHDVNRIDHVDAGHFADVALTPMVTNFPRHPTSPKRYSSPEPELYELDALNQAEANDSTRFLSSSLHSASHPSRKTPKKPRYPAVRTHGLDFDNTDGPSRRQTLRNRAGEIARQMSQRVVNSTEREDDEETQPLNIPEEGDVQSESESESNVSPITSRTDNRSDLALTGDQGGDSVGNERTSLDLKAQRQEVDELINSLLQQVDPSSGPIAQVTSKESKTLGSFGPDNAVRKACKGLLANRYVLFSLRRCERLLTLLNPVSPRLPSSS